MDAAKVALVSTLGAFFAIGIVLFFVFLARFEALPCVDIVHMLLLDIMSQWSVLMHRVSKGFIVLYRMLRFFMLIYAMSKRKE